MHKVVGRRLPRLDGVAKVTGNGRYTADIRPLGMLYGKILRSPLPHARIVRLDTRAAEALPGVRAVLTAADCPPTLHGATRADKPILCRDRVRFAGDEVAAVAADSPEVAEQALRLIEVEYEELPAVLTREEAAQPGASLVHEGAEGNVAAAIGFERGDVEAGLAEADCVVEETFYLTRQHQAYMEPQVCLARYDQGRYTLWAATQVPFRHRIYLAQALEVPENQVRVIQPFVGGGFGGKAGGLLPLFPIACLLAKKTARPVRIVYNREEEFLIGRPRVPATIRVRLGMRRDGIITAKEIEVTAECGAYSSNAGTITTAMATRHDNLYRYHNLRTRARLYYTNTPPCSSFRGLGNPQGSFAVETCIDMAAHKLGLDPAEVRLANMVQAGDVTIQGFKIQSCGLKEAIDRVTREAGWSERTGRPNRGLGLACCVHVSSSRLFFNYDGATAHVMLNTDGTVQLVTGEGEIGQGAFTALSQICDEALGVPYEWVQITPADTENTPFSHGAYGSRITTVAGNAVKIAAEDARRQVLALAAEMLEVSVDDLRLEDGEISVADQSGRRLHLKEAVRRGMSLGRPVYGSGAWHPDTEGLDPRTLKGNISPTYSFSAQVAEVEVDPETGAVRVLRILAADDVGTPINVITLEGQVEGGILQAMGFALCEDLIVRDGRVVNPNFLDYTVPTACEAPELTTILVDSYDPVGPFGAKGGSEESLVPTVAAIANAIHAAVGVRPTRLPMSPESIYRLCAKRSANPT